MLYDTWRKLGYGAADRDRRRRRGRRHSSATRRSRRGARSTWPTPRSARAWRSPRSSSRRRTPRCSTAARSSSPMSCRRIGPRDVEVAAARTGSSSRQVAKDLIRLMDHVVEEVPFYRDRTSCPGYYVGGKTGTAQIWDAENGARLEAQPLQLLVRRLHRPRGRACRTWSSPSGSRRARPRSLGSGMLEMPVMSFELFRRIATDAITTPDLLAEPAADDRPSAPPTGERSLWDTGRRDRRRTVDRDAVRADARRRSRPMTSSASPAAGCSPAPPDRSAARPSIRGCVAPGQLFVALPGERTDGHAHLPEAIRARRGRAPGHAARRPTRRRSAT